MKTILAALALSLAAGPALAPAANAQDAPAELGMGVFTFTSGGRCTPCHFSPELWIVFKLPSFFKNAFLN